MKKSFSKILFSGLVVSSLQYMPLSRAALEIDEDPTAAMLEKEMEAVVASEAAASRAIAKGGSLDDVSAQDFTVMYFKMDISANFDEIKDFAKIQENNFKKEIEELQSLKGQMDAKQKELQAKMEKNELSEEALKAELEILQAIAQKAQAKEAMLQQLQATIQGQVQEKITSLINSATKAVAEKMFKEKGLAVVIVPMLIGYIPKQLDCSSKIVEYVNAEYAKTKKKPVEKKTAAPAKKK